LGKQSPAYLHGLPAEILFNILELALLSEKPSTLALISRVIQQFVNAILYRTVILDNPKIIALLHRTASSPSSSHLLTHVKKLAITWDPDHVPFVIERQLGQIVVACTSLRLIAAPSFYPIKSLPPAPLLHDGSTEVILRTFESLDEIHLPFTPAALTTSLTHLRICEPSNSWHSPLSILSAFRGAPKLTHLQLARRADSNEDNDIIFAEEIQHILSTHKDLKTVAVTIFGGPQRISPFPVQESNVWVLISRVCEVDSRVILLEGQIGEWRDEWKDARRLRCGGLPTDFWMSVQRKPLPQSGSEDVRK
jgi:hypothetical protein